MQYLMLSMPLLQVSAFAIAQHSVTIKGHVKFIDETFKVGVYRHSGTIKKLLAEAPVNQTDHTYQLTVPFDEIGEATVDCGGWQAVSVWLEDENLDIDFRGLDTARIKIKNPPYVYIRGGRNNELMNDINFLSYRSYQSMIAYSQISYRTKFADEENKNTLTNALYDYNGNNADAYYRYFVEHFSDRNSVMAAVSRLPYDENKELIEGTLSRLESQSASSKMLVDKFRADMREAKRRQESMKVGAVAPAFECKNAKGKTLKPSDFKGKVLVLDFWASWCGPCRAEIPNLKKIYADYKDKGVEFLSVSIDAKKDAWTKAMNEEKMPWNQGWVADGGAHVMDLYQFGGIPFILVIDKEGNIYRKNVRGEEIRRAVSDALSGKKTAEKKSVSISMGAMSM